MRPLFYEDSDPDMKYELSSSNFKVYYETYLNPHHPYYNGGGLNIFNYAMIVDRTTGLTIRDNDKLTPGDNSGLSKYIKLKSYWLIGLAG